jgi:eukaryotic-like serine/threonine-protein kinase
MIGTKLGQYEITSHLGTGGMGEVYQATDTRLGRSVAIKFLPEGFSHDGERVARFQREARVLASLNHPNVAAIYGVDEVSGRHFLVMELVPGETLEERIRRGALPLAEALLIAKQIAEGVEQAHEAGIVHRDLKPANIKITADDKVKVLDFGLAKTNQLEQSDVSQSMSPTLTMSATSAGVIMGTAAYMSPEQARGRPVDRRADIWAFGVVLFRMLSGGRIFEGDTVTETLAKIIEREPEWEQLPASTPPPLRKLLQRCLTKNPKNRLQAIGDARIVIQELIEKPEQAEQPQVIERIGTYPLWTRVLPWAVAAVCLAGAVLLWLWPSAPAPDRPVLQFDYPLPATNFLAHNNRHAVEVSRDGRRVAFIAAAQGMPRRIFVRSLDQPAETAIAGTEGATNLTFSPDSNWLAFQQGQQIKKVALSGGAPVVVVENLNLAQDVNFGGAGFTWGTNGTIVFPNTLGVGLSMVRDVGGKPEEFTTLDEAAHEASHRLPHFLPDGSAVLFTVVRFSAVAPDWSRAQVWVKSVKTGGRKLLVEDAVDARYAGENTLIFARRGKLFAIPFDVSTLSIRGKEVQVVDGVTQSEYGQAAVTWTGAAQYSLAANGDLFYAPGSIEPPLLSALVWVDRTGKPTPVAGMRNMFRFGARILPDGVRLASSELYLNKDIWIFDSTRGTEDRATYEGQNAFPIWAPDGSRFAFRSDREGPQKIYVSSLANPREAKRLTSGPFDVPSSWTPDGKELLFTRGYASLGGNTDVYAVSIDQPDKLRPILATPADERFPELSPDGKWLAYTSNDAGRPELYVQPYPGPGMRVTITSGGAADPAWSKKGNELFYRLGNQIMAVPFTVAGESFRPGKPVALFEQGSLGSGTTVRATYDVAADGRFLLNQPIPDAAQERSRRMAPVSLRFVLNWTQGIQQLLAPR